MQNVIDPKTVETLSQEIFSRLDAISAKAVEAGGKYGPDIIDAGLKIVQINSIQQIIYGIVFLIAAIPFLKFAIMFSKAGAKNGFDNPGDFFGAAFSIIATVFCFVACFMRLSSIWLWLGVFQPKLFIAHELLDKVLN